MNANLNTSSLMRVFEKVTELGTLWLAPMRSCERYRYQKDCVPDCN